MRQKNSGPFLDRHILRVFKHFYIILVAVSKIKIWMLLLFQMGVSVWNATKQQTIKQHKADGILTVREGRLIKQTQGGLLHTHTQIFRKV